MTDLLSSPFAVLAAVGLASAVFLFARQSSDRVGELRGRRPPLVKSWIPFMGSAIDYGKDVDSFLASCKQAYGPIFTLHLAGQKITYATTPELIAAIYKNSKAFVFLPIRAELSTTLFGMTKELSSADIMQEVVFPDHHRLLARGAIGEMSAKLIKRVERDLLARLPKDGKPFEIGLHELTVRGLYDATSEAFFGEDYNSDPQYETFNQYDHDFPMVAAGLPSFISPAVRSSMAALKKLSAAFIAHLTEHPLGTPNSSNLVRHFLQVFQDAGVSKPDVASFMISSQWASTANANWGEFWVLSYILTHPGLASSLRAQIQTTYAAYLASGGEGPLADMLCADSCKALDSAEGLDGVRSAIKETLRMVSSSFSVRLAHEDAVLEDPTVDEGGWAFKKGERVICATRLVHFSPSIYPSPSIFLPTRFLATQPSPPPQEIIQPTIKASQFLAFGGGVSQCEGRFFAMRELVAFTCLAMWEYDFEVIGVTKKDGSLVDGSGDGDGDGKNEMVMRPEVDLYRSGFGILHSKPERYDLKVRVTGRGP